MLWCIGESTFSNTGNTNDVPLSAEIGPVSFLRHKRDCVDISGPAFDLNAFMAADLFRIYKYHN